MASFKLINSQSIIAELNSYSKDVAIGASNPMDLLILLKQIKDKIDEIEEVHIDTFSKSASIYNKTSYQGYGIEVRTGGGRYTYDHIPVYSELSSRLKAVQEQAKQSYKIALSGSLMVSEDGEQIASAIFVPSKDSIIIKKQK